MSRRCLSSSVMVAAASTRSSRLSSCRWVNSTSLSSAWRFNISFRYTLCKPVMSPVQQYRGLFHNTTTDYIVKYLFVNHTQGWSNGQYLALVLSLSDSVLHHWLSLYLISYIVNFHHFLQRLLIFTSIFIMCLFPVMVHLRLTLQPKPGQCWVLLRLNAGQKPYLKMALHLLPPVVPSCILRPVGYGVYAGGHVSLTTQTADSCHGHVCKGNTLGKVISFYMACNKRRVKLLLWV